MAVSAASNNTDLAESWSAEETRAVQTLVLFKVHHCANFYTAFSHPPISNPFEPF